MQKIISGRADCPVQEKNYRVFRRTYSKKHGKQFVDVGCNKYKRSDKASGR